MKLENLIKCAIAGVAALSASTLFAQSTTYWTGNEAATSNGATSASNTGNYSTGTLPDSTTDLVFDAAHLTGEKTLSPLFDTDTTYNVRDFTIAEGYGSMLNARFGVSSRLNIAGNFNILSRASHRFFFNSAGTDDKVPGIDVVGNLNVGSAEYAGSTSIALYFSAGHGNGKSGWGPVNLNIGGDAVFYSYVNAYFGGSDIDPKTFNSRTFDVAAAQVKIGGVMNLAGKGGTDNPNVYLVYRSQAGASDIPASTVNVVSADGLIGNGKVTGYGDGQNSYTGVLMLTNSADRSFAGWVTDGQAKIGIIMDAINPDATQYVRGGLQSFTGGVTVRNGTLAINAYYNSYGKSSADTHGELIMAGGTFKTIENSTTSTCIFGFDSVEYSAGTIDLTIFGTTGSGLKLYSGSKSMFFLKDLGDDVQFLFNLAAGGEADLTDGNYYRIVEWNVKADYNGDRFAANKIGDFNAEFDVRDDGLYVRYVNAVPEPATYAALFGLFAMALVAYRKRR